MTMPISLLDLCSYLGLGAVGGITINLWLGMLISLRYSPVRVWPHRHIDIFRLHRWTAYIAIALTLAHPTILLFLHTPRFRWIDVLFPIHSYLQPKLNLAGAAALYILVLVLVTSLLRAHMPRLLWRQIHYMVFPAAMLMFLHSILTDPELRDGHPDLLDGGKVFIEAATLLCVIAVALRVRSRENGFRTKPAAARANSV